MSHRELQFYDIKIMPVIIVGFFKLDCDKPTSGKSD